MSFAYAQPDARGRFGPINGTYYGGSFVAETLVHALDELKAARSPGNMGGDPQKPSASAPKTFEEVFSQKPRQ